MLFKSCRLIRNLPIHYNNLEGTKEASPFVFRDLNFPFELVKFYEQT